MAIHDPANPDFSDDSPVRFAPEPGAALSLSFLICLGALALGGMAFSKPISNAIASTDPNPARRGSTGELAAIHPGASAEIPPDQTATSPSSQPEELVWETLARADRSALAIECAVRSATAEKRGANAEAHLWAALAAESIRRPDLAAAHEAEALRLAPAAPRGESALNSALPGYAAAKFQIQ